MKAKFYTDSNRYMGYSKVNDSTYFELRSWILSGNYLIIDDERVSTVDQLDKIFKNN